MVSLSSKNWSDFAWPKQRKVGQRENIHLPINLLAVMPSDRRFAQVSCSWNGITIYHIPPDLVVDRWACDGESGSHRNFLFRHNVWTMFHHQIS
jgi:hypothetical protein